MGMTSDREARQSAEPESGPRPDRRLHLQSLLIEAFRGIGELSIPRLGRATLLAGRNGVGKTTVLDAVRVYASRARLAALSELLMGREEIRCGRCPRATSTASRKNIVRSPRARPRGRSSMPGSPREPSRSSWGPPSAPATSRFMERSRHDLRIGSGSCSRNRLEHVVWGRLARRP